MVGLFIILLLLDILWIHFLDGAIRYSSVNFFTFSSGGVLDARQW